MLTAVDVTPKFLESYRQAVLPGVIESIRHDARDLAGARVLHVNATTVGFAYLIAVLAIATTWGLSTGKPVQWGYFGAFAAVMLGSLFFRSAENKTDL